MLLITVISSVRPRSTDSSQAATGSFHFERRLLMHRRRPPLCSPLRSATVVRLSPAPPQTSPLFVCCSGSGRGNGGSGSGNCSCSSGNCGSVDGPNVVTSGPGRSNLLLAQSAAPPLTTPSATSTVEAAAAAAAAEGRLEVAAAAAAAIAAAADAAAQRVCASGTVAMGRRGGDLAVAAPFPISFGPQPPPPPRLPPPLRHVPPPPCSSTPKKLAPTRGR